MASKAYEDGWMLRDYFVLTSEGTVDHLDAWDAHPTGDYGVDWWVCEATSRDAALAATAALTRLRPHPDGRVLPHAEALKVVSHGRAP